MRHSKFRNTGILFELLTRQITADIIAGKPDSEARGLLFNYFKENTELGKEWRLYNFLLSEKIKGEQHLNKRRTHYEYDFRTNQFCRTCICEIRSTDAGPVRCPDSGFAPG